MNGFGPRSMWHLFALVWCCLAPGVQAAGEDAGFRVIEARTRLVAGVYRLDANIEFRLSVPVREALLNGVPLVIEIDMEVVEPRRWLPDKGVASLTQGYRLSYHALSERFLVRNLNTGARRSFGALEDALLHLGTIRDFPLLDEDLLVPGRFYMAGLRAGLDIEALPTPVQMMAYVTPAWWLGSDWYTWPLKP